jgi:hypothetical protein
MGKSGAAAMYEMITKTIAITARMVVISKFIVCSGFADI